ncbi:hypothetical protein N0V91_000282 [Didymella pomorum]|uniref:Uncharacterized protein n=1 Tax=Didymella pomorum TaxID=749634 RepID=A0A9W9DC86_9PLEO|nr:hypothetical protein N0V91_000282 [Didymella pomorum]
MPFAAPTSEVEVWQPDPDSLPVAGGLPDARFNKDPLTAQQKKALKRDKLLGLYLNGPRESTRASSPAASSTARTNTPNDARKFAHLLGDSPPKKSGPPPAPQDRKPSSPPVPAAPATSVSRPPHLRKQSSASTSATPAAAPETRTNSINVIGSPHVGVEPTVAPTALPPSSTSHLRKVADATDPDLTGLVENLAVQKRLLESFIPNKPTPSTDSHERYLKGKLISALEEEMDTPTRTTRRKLNNMNDVELAAHFMRTKAMHKLSWEIKQRRDDIGKLDVKASLAAF